MPNYEARVYGVFGSKYYDIIADSPQEAAELSRKEFGKDWQHQEDDNLWWTENTDSVAIEDDDGKTWDFATKNGMDELVPFTSVYLLQSVVPFVSEIARMMKDGETHDDGSEFIMENDDAVDTLHSLISGARALCGISDD
jgi:hypothetical protein